MRKDKINYYLDIAETISQRSTCLRRKYGAIIVNNDEIISTGYNGAARGCVSCLETGICKRKELNIPSGERYELCKSVHSEQNAIISASRRDMMNGAMYLVGTNVITTDDINGYLNKNTEPCLLCKRMIVNAGIEKVIIRRAPTEYEIQYVNDLKL